jgi:hypothetical protein
MWCLDTYEKLYNGKVFVTSSYARMAQWKERRRKDVMIHESLVRIPLWDVGASLFEESL